MLGLWKAIVQNLRNNRGLRGFSSQIKAEISTIGYSENKLNKLLMIQQLRKLLKKMGRVLFEEILKTYGEIGIPSYMTGLCAESSYNKRSTDMEISSETEWKPRKIYAELTVLQ